MDERAQYFNSLELGNKSENTIRAYKKDVNKLYEFFDIRSIEQLASLSVSDFHTFYGSQNFKENTSLNSLIRNLLSYFNFLARSEYISDKHAFFKVRFGSKRFADVKVKRKAVLSPQESESLISAARNLQEKFMLSLMVETAIRRSEVANIKLSDISGCQIKLTAKGDEEIYTYLNTNLCELLGKYLSEERDTDSEYLFYPVRGEEVLDEYGKVRPLTGTSINNRVRSAARRCGIPEEKAEKITAHRLRGSGITRIALMHGLDVARKVANHKSINTTMGYDESKDDVVRRTLLGETA